MTIPVGIRNYTNEQKWYTFLIDTGSYSSYINESLVQELGLTSINLETSSYSLASASGEILVIIEKKVTTDI